MIYLVEKTCNLYYKYMHFRLLLIDKISNENFPKNIEFLFIPSK